MASGSRVRRRRGGGGAGLAAPHAAAAAASSLCVLLCSGGFLAEFGKLLVWAPGDSWDLCARPHDGFFGWDVGVTAEDEKSI